MSDTLAPNSEQNTQIDHAARIEKVIGGLEDAQAAEALQPKSNVIDLRTPEAPTVDQDEPTTGELRDHFAKPSVEAEDRDPQPSDPLATLRAERARANIARHEQRQKELTAIEDLPGPGVVSAEALDEAGIPAPASELPKPKGLKELFGGLINKIRGKK